MRVPTSNASHPNHPTMRATRPGPDDAAATRCAPSPAADVDAPRPPTGSTPSPTSGTCALARRPNTPIMTASTTAAAALTQKIARHDHTARIAAPSSGPSTDPTSCTADTIPSAMPRRPRGSRSATRASVAGTSPPPPMPWMTRPPTMTGRSTASAVTTLPRPNSTRHHSNTRWRETRSDSRPMSGSTAM